MISPHASSRNTHTSQSGDTGPSDAAAAASDITWKPAAANARPRTNFTRTDARAPSRSHSIANSGAATRMKKGIADWNQAAGIVTPNWVRSVASCANRFSRDPACPTPIQNSAAARRRRK
ncbi:hypothetical protein BJF79_44685 [Actinomadura sp. CNU-125]|nr:hypothetical protein BJF79_44685 [Actinomadura sp. CNU-125]